MLVFVSLTYRKRSAFVGSFSNDDELMLNVLRCHLTY